MCMENELCCGWLLAIITILSMAEMGDMGFPICRKAVECNAECVVDM